MTGYELMIKTNHYLIKGGVLTDTQRKNIAVQLFAQKCTSEAARRFYTGVKYPGNTDENGRQMYPLFFIPPYNGGEKHKTVFNQTPKTHIFSANMYELEILRLLWILTFENTDSPLRNEVCDMVDSTLARLETTCFGYMDDVMGECFDTSLVVLRFLAAAAQGATKWIQSRIDNYNIHAGDKKRPWFSKWYFWLCLSELPLEMARPQIDKNKGEILNWLKYKSCVMNSEHDKTIHPVLMCILRNIISKYPEYEHIKSRQPYISEKDGRL